MRYKAEGDGEDSQSPQVNDIQQPVAL